MIVRMILVVVVTEMRLMMTMIIVIGDHPGW
jgi:hypothetical protein